MLGLGHLPSHPLRKSYLHVSMTQLLLMITLFASDSANISLFSATQLPFVRFQFLGTIGQSHSLWGRLPSLFLANLPL